MASITAPPSPFIPIKGILILPSSIVNFLPSDKYISTGKSSIPLASISTTISHIACSFFFLGSNFGSFERSSNFCFARIPLLINSISKSSAFLDRKAA